MQCAATRGDMTAEPALGTLFWPRASVKPAVETQETQRGPTKEAMCRRRQGGGILVSSRGVARQKTRAKTDVE